MFTVNEIEMQHVLDAYFISKDPLVLHTMPSKQKKRYIALLWIATLFEKDQIYKEKDVNIRLMPVYPDYVMLRRYLIDYKLFTRDKDGSAYRKS